MLGANSIALVGMMGAGKTTVGCHLAKNFNFSFIDLDQEIVRSRGLDITTIFADEGEDNFRKYESEALASFCGQGGIVLSTGGGVVTTDTNRLQIKKYFWVAYLQASSLTLFARIKECKDRPLLQGGDFIDRLEALQRVRATLYEQIADVVIGVDKMSSMEVASTVNETFSFQRNNGKN